MDKHRDAVKRGVVFSPILHVMASNDYTFCFLTVKFGVKK
jgi:hypothetical protein